MSDEVSQFLESVERLRGQQIEEDEVRARELEEYLAAKRERQARRQGEPLMFPLCIPTIPLSITMTISCFFFVILRLLFFPQAQPLVSYQTHVRLWGKRFGAAPSLSRPTAHQLLFAAWFLAQNLVTLISFLFILCPAMHLSLSLHEP